MGSFLDFFCSYFQSKINSENLFFKNFSQFANRGEVICDHHYFFAIFHRYFFWVPPPFWRFLGPPGTNFRRGTYCGGDLPFSGGGPKCLSKECATIHKLVLDRHDKQTDIVSASFLRRKKVTFAAPTYDGKNFS